MEGGGRAGGKSTGWREKGGMKRRGRMEGKEHDGGRERVEVRRASWIEEGRRMEGRGHGGGMGTR